jgi:DSF synthase
MWAEAALTLTTRDLRLMERLARAQARKVGGGDEGAVEELKRIELDTAWGELREGHSAFAEERGTGVTAWGGLGN